MYTNYIVLLMKDKKLYAMHDDYHMWEYFHHDIKLLEKKKISYIVIHNLEIIKRVEYPDNQYYRYKKLVFIERILEKYKK